MKVRKILLVALMSLIIPTVALAETPKEIVKTVKIEWIDPLVGGHVNTDTVYCYKGEDCEAKVDVRSKEIEKFGGQVIDIV